MPVVRHEMPMESLRHDSPMTAERGVIGRLPYLAVGSGAPMLFIAGLSPQAGVETA
jgi:hypothetical protein